MTTKFAPSKMPGEPAIPIVNIDEHQKDMARRRAEHLAKKPFLLRCIDPQFARQQELKKPMYQYTVTAEWFGNGESGAGFHGPFKREVAAQNENDAWSRFCDSIEKFPNRSEATVEFTRGKKLTTEQAEAVMSSAKSGHGYDSDDGAEFRRYSDPEAHKRGKR